MRSMYRSLVSFINRISIMRFQIEVWGGAYWCLKLKTCLMLALILCLGHLINGIVPTLSFKCCKLNLALNQCLAWRETHSVHGVSHWTRRQKINYAAHRQLKWALIKMVRIASIQFEYCNHEGSRECVYSHFEVGINLSYQTFMAEMRIRRRFMGEKSSFILWLNRFWPIDAFMSY